MKVNQKGKKVTQTTLYNTHAINEQGKNSHNMLQEGDGEDECNDRSKDSPEYQMKMMNNMKIEVLDQCLSEKYEARMHAERACEEKDYELRSTKVHVRELEEELEEDLIDKKDSSGLSGVEKIEEYFENEKEEEDSNEDENEVLRKCFKRDALVKEITNDIKRNNKLVQEILVKKAHFSS